MSLRKRHGILVATSRVTNMLCRGDRRDPSEISRTTPIWLRSLKATNRYPGVANAYRIARIRADGATTHQVQDT
jgi:hypothetical protein